MKNIRQSFWLISGVSESRQSSALPAISKLGPVHTTEHLLIKPQSRAKIFLPLSGLSSRKYQNQTQKILQKSSA
jgi:hypothetical protein